MARLSSFLTSILAFGASLARAAQYTNPIKNDTADPFMIYDSGKWWLFSTAGDIRVANASKVAGLQDAPKVVWYTDSDPSRDVDFWGSEVHNFNGIWYIFYSASTSSTATNARDEGRRIHVLKGGSSVGDPYTYAGQLGDLWAIDPTVLFDGGNHYLVWSCRAGGDGLSSSGTTQSLCIGQLDGPTTLLNRYVLSIPSQSWETNGFPVNEAPNGVYYNGRTFLTFSASWCQTAQYSLGLLSYNGGGILNSSSWTKSGPIFTSANGDYGPGSNGFVLNPGTTQDWWQVYHATPLSSGDCGASRNTFFQPFNWNSDGTPNLGQPEPIGSVHDGPSGEGN